MTVKNPFPYPGGKSMYASKIIDRIPDHTCYVEPFGGAGSVLLQKSKSDVEVYNDLNDDVVTFFRVLRDRHDELIEYLHHTPFARSVHQEILDRWYGEDDRPDDDVARAAEFFYLRLVNFGGIFGRSGFSASKERSVAEFMKKKTDALDEVRDRYKSVVIENRDWKTVVDKYDGDDTFFYFDPPYTHIDDDRMYGADDPTAFDHDRFCDAVAETDGKWIISYSDVPDALDDFRVTAWDQEWKMATGKTDETVTGKESLVMNFDPTAEPSHTTTEPADQW